MDAFLRRLPKSPEGHWARSHLPIVTYIKQHVKPKTILEIGLNTGFSTVMWLMTCPLLTLYSIDIGWHPHIDKVVTLLRTQFGDRFHFQKMNSKALHQQDDQPVYDVVFIDGGHQRDVCLSDLNFAYRHARYILLDDTAGKSPGVTQALREFRRVHGNKALKLIKSFNHIGAGAMLFQNDSLGGGDA